MDTINSEGRLHCKPEHLATVFAYAPLHMAIHISPLLDK